MLLQQIVQKLDAELDRLERLRKIVVGLDNAPDLMQQLTPRLEELLLPAPEPQPRLTLQTQPELRAEAELAEKPVRRYRPRKLAIPRPYAARAKEGAPVQMKTLTSAIPSGPVVVSAQALARERQARFAAQSTPVQEPEPLLEQGRLPNTLARRLSERWLAGLSTATV